MAVLCRGEFYKRLLLLLTVAMIVILMLVIGKTSNRPSQNVFEVREPKQVITSSEKVSGLRVAINSLTNAVHDTIISEPKNPFGVNDTAFHEILLQRAGDSKTIVLSSVDSGYVDMAVNLYLTSFRKFNISNYLFVGSDSEVCNALGQYNIVCFEYIHDKDSKTASSYFSAAFRRKTHLKTKIILEALHLNLKVLITDVDIVFTNNPLPLMNCDSCDIEISSDVSEGNSGFYIARPTAAAIKLHETAWSQGLTKPQISNQKAIDRTMERMVKQKKMKVRNLDPKVFTNGLVYYEKGNRMFKGDNPCVNCVIVHNNWIVSGVAKIYRFKESGLWDSDISGYYSNTSSRYITFGLPGDYGKSETLSSELKALQYAFILGAILDRIVILPQFHCYGCKHHPNCNHAEKRCHFGSFYKIQKFDAQLENKYRESVFLSHDRIPKLVKESESPLYFIDSTLNRKKFPTLPDGIEPKTPSTRTGATMDEIINWFGNSTASVLRFHSLYHGIDYDEKHPKVADVLKKLKLAFTRSDFRQLSG